MLLLTRQHRRASFDSRLSERVVRTVTVLCVALPSVVCMFTKKKGRGDNRVDVSSIGRSSVSYTLRFTLPGTAPVDPVDVSSSAPPRAASPSPFVHIHSECKEENENHFNSIVDEWECVTKQIRAVSPVRSINEDMEKYFEMTKTWSALVREGKKDLEETVAAMKTDDKFNPIVRSLMRERPSGFDDDALRSMFTDVGFKSSPYGRREAIKKRLHDAPRRMSKRMGIYTHI